MRHFMKIFTVIILTIMVLSPSTVFGQFFYMENEDIGKQVKDFTLKVVNGEEVSFNTYRDGNKAMIFFWATWCPHCRVELKKLNETKEILEKDKFKIVLVDVGEAEDIVDNYLKKNGITFDVFLDLDSQVSENYGLIGVPTFYFVDEKGVVVDVMHSLPKDLNQPFSNS